MKKGVFSVKEKIKNLNINPIIYFAFKFLSLYLLPFVIGIFVSFFVQKPVKAINKKTK